VWLDTVRIARDFGTVAELFPSGVENVRDLPWRWFEAIRMAMFFLSFEELAEDERPSKKIWLDSEALEAHFAQVKAKRKREVKGDSTLEGESVSNKAASGLIVGG
jgi:hypothetical protein